MILKNLKILETGVISLFLSRQQKKTIDEKKILNSAIFLTLHDRDNDTLKNNIKDLLCVAPNLSNKIVKLFNKNLLCGISISSSWEQDANINNKITIF